MGAKREFTTEEARQIGERIGVNWDEYDIEQFRMGLAVELEHGLHDGQTNVTDDDELTFHGRTQHEIGLVVLP